MFDDEILLIVPVFEFFDEEGFLEHVQRAVAFGCENGVCDLIGEELVLAEDLGVLDINQGFGLGAYLDLAHQAPFEQVAD